MKRRVKRSGSSSPDEGTLRTSSTKMARRRDGSTKKWLSTKRELDTNILKILFNKESFWWRNSSTEKSIH